MTHRLFEKNEKQTAAFPPLRWALGLALVLASSAWGTLDDEFALTKKAYTEKREALTVPMKRLFIQRLEELMERHLEAAHYEDYLKCQEARDALVAELGEALSAPFSLILVPEEAALGGGVRVDEGGGDALEKWGPGTTATWKLPGVRPGGYEVWLEHSSTTAPLTWRLQERNFYVERSSNVVSGEKATWKWTSLGNLKITEGTGRLELSLPGTQVAGDVRLRKLKLISHAP